MKINLSGIISESIVDGPGIRYVVFTQGCNHGCIGCHNPLTHSTKPNKIMECLDVVNNWNNNCLFDGVTISGGEPFLQPLELYELVMLFKQKLDSTQNIIIYTGYTFEELVKINDSTINNILKNIDYLIDGKFIMEQRDLTLEFRGSANQRIIDVKKTLEDKFTIHTKTFKY